MVVRMRHNKSQTRSRRAHHALKGPALLTCSHCGTPKEKHRICMNCGTYKGMSVIDVVAQTARKETKRKEKAKAIGQAQSNDQKGEDK